MSLNFTAQFGEGWRRYLASYKDFPPRQRPATFSIDQVMEKVSASMKSGR
jgi:hypothetical protein